MIATVAWLGGLAGASFFVFPMIENLADPAERGKQYERVIKTLGTIGWLSLATLTGTGLIQMSVNPNYEGLLAVTNPWSVSIFAKHILFLVMIGVSAYQTWGILPAFQREVLRVAKGLPAQQIDLLQTRNRQLIVVNLALGTLILILTAFARASI
jgi:uncharacterized membrane protein